MSAGIPLRIFHCADLHLGLRFSRYPDEVAAQLRDARFSTLERMVARANADACDLFVVAGDLFDTLKVAQRDVARAAKILAGFDRVVALLPGNHDFHAGGADDFWKAFPRPEHGRVLLLDEYRPYPLREFGIDAVLYPSHCDEKKSEGRNALGWLGAAARPEARFHVGIAHGSFEGLSPDLEGDYFPMTHAELEAHKLDLWLLGHIHVQYPPKPGAGQRVFYSGTHEPDGMDCRHEGKSWRLDLHDDKSVVATSVSTGAFRFEDTEVEVRAGSELEQLLSRFPADASRNRLLRLRLRGSLPREAFEELPGLVEKLKARLLHFEPDFSGLRLALTAADIDREYPRGGFAHRLLTSLAAAESDREALQAAFELLGDGK